MSEPAVIGTPDELAGAYVALRARCLELGRSLTDDQAASMSPCCPAWSVKDLYAHMSGVASDILSGNTEGAATEAWADAQVERRADDSLATICDEWEGNGPAVDDVVRAFAANFPPQFYIDAWTHEWDIRQALGTEMGAVPDMALIEATRPFLTQALHQRAVELQPSLGGDTFDLTLTGGADGASWTSRVGEGDAASSIEMSLFEFARITMGRRSASQIQAVRPDADPSLLVFWSVNGHDIVDPVFEPS